MQPLGHGNEIPFGATRADEPLGGDGLRHAVLTGFFLDHENRITIGRGHHGGERDGCHFGSFAQGKQNASEHAGAEEATRITQRALEADVARHRVDFGIHRGKFAVEKFIGIDIGDHTQRAARGELGEQLLREEEVDEDRVEGLQGNDFVPLVDELPEVGFADSEASGERSAQLLLPDGRAQLLDQGGHLAQIRLGRVHLRLRHGAVDPQLFCAVVNRAGQIGFRFGRSQVRLLGLRVELQQQVTFLHFLPVFEKDFRHHPGLFRAQVGTLHGTQRTHRLDRALPAFLGHGRGADRLDRRTPTLLAGGNQPPDLERLHAGHNTDRDKEEGERKEERFQFHAEAGQG